MSVDFDNGFIVGLATTNGSTSGTGGKYKVEDVINPSNLSVYQAGGSEIWNILDTRQVQAVVCDKYGNIYVAFRASTGHIVCKFDPSGNELWHSSDSIYAYNLAVDNDCNVYVVYNYSSGKNVRKLNSDGVEQWSLSDITLAKGIAVDTSGYVYVAYYGSSTLEGGVRKLDSNGNEIWRKFDIKYASCVVADNLGNVYVGYQQQLGTNVRKLNSLGEEIWSLSDNSPVYTVNLDSHGNLYVGYYDSPRKKALVKFNSSGVELWDSILLALRVISITVDSNDDIYVVCWTGSGKVIRKLNPSGIEIWSSSDLTYALDTAVDSSGNLYAVYGYFTTLTKKIRKLHKDTIYTITG